MTQYSNIKKVLIFNIMLLLLNVTAFSLNFFVVLKQPQAILSMICVVINALFIIVLMDTVFSSIKEARNEDSERNVRN